QRAPPCRYAVRAERLRRIVRQELRPPRGRPLSRGQAIGVRSRRPVEAVLVSRAYSFGTVTVTGTRPGFVVPTSFLKAAGVRSMTPPGAGCRGVFAFPLASRANGPLSLTTTDIDLVTVFPCSSL